MGRAMEDLTNADLSGMTGEVTVTIDAPIDAVWDLLSDVERMAGLGPEHSEAHWISSGPAPGARFRGRNRIDQFDWEVTCVITECVPPVLLEWTVGEPSEPSSTWSYRLTPDGGRTVVVQRFRHGPGFSYVRRMVDRHPDEADAIVAQRRAMLCEGMTATLEAAGRVLAAGSAGR